MVELGWSPRLAVRMEFADFNPGSVVRDHSGLTCVSACGQHQRQVGSHSITRADDVIHLARCGRNARDLAAPRDQRHAMLAEREQQVRHIEPRQRGW